MPEPKEIAERLEQLNREIDVCLSYDLPIEPVIREINALEMSVLGEREKVIYGGRGLSHLHSYTKVDRMAQEH